jgi:hypothetical protein
LSVTDGDQVLQDLTPEPPGESEVQRQHEIASLPGEIVLELAGRVVKPARGLQHPRADPIGQRLQHGTMALALIGQSDQSLLGGGHQQRTEG